MSKTWPSPSAYFSVNYHSLKLSPYTCANYANSWFYFENEKKSLRDSFELITAKTV